MRDASPGNGIGDEGAEALAKALRLNDTLQSLSLFGMYMDCRVIVVLLEEVSIPFCSFSVCVTLPLCYPSTILTCAQITTLTMKALGRLQLHWNRIVG